MTLIGPEIVVPEDSEVGRVFDTARALLDNYLAFFDLMGVEVPLDRSGAPYAFVSNGSIAYDAELVAVEVKGIHPGSVDAPAISSISAGWQYALELDLHLTRAVPMPESDGVGPSIDEIEASAKQILLDHLVILEGAIALTRAGMEGETGLVTVPFRRVAIQTVGPYGPHGGIGGTVATLLVEMR